MYILPSVCIVRSTIDMYGLQYILPSLYVSPEDRRLRIAVRYPSYLFIALYHLLGLVEVLGSSL